MLDSASILPKRPFELEGAKRQEAGDRYRALLLLTFINGVNDLVRALSIAYPEKRCS
jgi:hypothetical protein